MTKPQWYAVEVRETCTMLVYVQAIRESDAKAKVLDGDYEQMTDWEPIKWPPLVQNIYPKPDYEPPEFYG